MRRLASFRLLLVALPFALAAPLCGQQTTGPKPAARSVPTLSELNDTQDQAQTPDGQLQPDDNPPTGVLAPTLGQPVLEHSFVMFGAQFASTAESQGLGSGGWYADNYFLGNLSLVKNWTRGLTSVNYSGGGYVSTQQGSTGNGDFQNFSFLQNLRTARWNFSLVDGFALLPQSQFGFGGGTNIGQPGTGGTLPVSPPGLTTAPSQNILSATGVRYTNTAVAQASYTLTARDSLTFGGSYGLLNFSGSGNLNNDTIAGTAGYNRKLSKGDTIGLFYSFSSFHFVGNPQALGSHSFGVAYARKITGKLALQLSGGPQVNTSRIPENGATKTVAGFGSANLMYGLKNGNITLNYIYNLSNGSGVLVGSQINEVTFGVSHRLGRVWTGFADFGYSRNSPFGQVANTSNSTYNDWFLGGGISRPFGREVTFALAYTASFERSNQQAGCTGQGCNTDFTQQMINLSFQWHARPVVLR